MIYDKARELARDLSASEEYREYKRAREKAYENATTKALLKDYHSMQMKAHAAVLAGKKDDADMEQLQKLGELLQLNVDASAFLIAEYRLNAMLSDVYKILGEAIDVDLRAFEE